MLCIPYPHLCVRLGVFFSSLFIRKLNSLFYTSQFWSSTLDPVPTATTRVHCWGETSSPHCFSLHTWLTFPGSSSASRNVSSWSFFVSTVYQFQGPHKGRLNKTSIDSILQTQPALNQSRDLLSCDLNAPVAMVWASFPPYALFFFCGGWGSLPYPSKLIV